MKSFFHLFSLRSNVYLPLFAAIMAFSAPAFSQTGTLSVQGVLTKSDGTAVDDGNDYSLTFRLWKNATSTAGADKAYEETIDGITIVGGVYSVVLGEDLMHPLTAPFNQPYWLGVSVGTSSAELLPRPRLTHAPYALGLVGQNNTVPSTGPIVADGYRAEAGPVLGGPNGNGFGFKPGGDQDGGMFSTGTNNVELWAGGQKRAKLTNGQNEMYGNLTNFGTFTSNDQTINGNQTVNGFTTISNGQTVNGVQTINSNQIINGFSTVSANQTVNGVVKSGTGIVNANLTSTGMFFNNNNHDIQFNINGSGRVLLGDNGTNYINSTTEINVTGANDYLYIKGVKPKGTTGNPRNIAIDLSNGRIFEESSSRRYKTNIRPLQDDFRLLLKAQPCVYNRFQDPADIDTSKYYELGYIAEEFDSIGLHKLVQYNNEGQIDCVNYNKIILYAVELIKMQDTAIKALQTEVAELKEKNKTLATQNVAVQAENSDVKKQQEKIEDQLVQLLKRMQVLETASTGK